MSRGIGASGSLECSFDGETGLNYERALTIFYFRLSHRSVKLADCGDSRWYYMHPLPCFGNCYANCLAARTAPFSC